MIVKDEAHVMPRCLKALKPYIDSWLIVDTGSTDNTKEIILEELEGLPGEIHDIPFESFKKNRTEALELARTMGGADYLLMIDADDTWVPDKGFHWSDLTAGAYDVKLVLGGTAYWRPFITKADLPWRYEAAVQEYMACDVPCSRVRLHGVRVECGNDGARRKNEPVKKYERVAAVLEEEHKKDPSNRRNVFYLAQAYRDSGNLAKGIEFYEKRAEMGGFAEEVWFSLYRVGRLHERSGHDWTLARDAYLKAFNLRPSRAEAMICLANIHRRQKMFSLAMVYAEAAIQIPYPESDSLFIDEYAYQWRALDEFATLALKLGRADEAKQANLKALQCDPLPPRHRIEQNLTFCCTPMERAWSEPGKRITVCLSTYQCRDGAALRTAVESILGQTYENLLLVVVSDGDPDTPWSAIEDIDDPRMISVEFPENIGQYAVYDAVLNATPDAYMAIQGDSGTSHHGRLERLMDAMCSTNADVTFSDIVIQDAEGNAVHRPADPRRMSDRPDGFACVGSHFGLWKTQSVRSVGGYYGGYREGGVAAVSLVSRLGRPAFLRKPLYTKVVDQESWKDLPDLWDRISESENPIAKAHEIMQSRIPDSARQAIEKLADTVRAILPEENSPSDPQDSPG